MRKTRAAAIRKEEFARPDGTSHSAIRAARRAYSNGLKRVPQPKPIASVGHPGFPSNTVSRIETALEKQPRIATIKDRVYETTKGGVVKPKTFLKSTGKNREKLVTKVITTKKK